MLLTACLALCLVGGTAPADPLPWLKTDGRRLVTDPGGRKVVLRGANIMASEWDGTMEWERRAFPMLATDWRANVVVRGFAADPVNARDPSYLSWLDEYVALAETNRIYVVFAFRSYALNGPQPRFPRRRATRALAYLAARYRHRSNVMYALQVEPHGVRWGRLRSRFEAMIDAVRAAAEPRTPVIMVPGVNWSRDLSPAIARPVRRAHVVYKTHPYTSARDFDRYFGNVHAAGLPVFVGEFGDAPAIGMTMDDVVALLRYTREREIGWAAWIFDVKGPPTLLASRDGTPTVPYGATVRDELLTTPPVPPWGATSLRSGPDACSRSPPARSRLATWLRRARSAPRCR
jgi:Cellulase (glycosyl hydrolase family 5)